MTMNHITWAVVPAGGSSQRFGGGDKLLAALAGEPVLAHTLNALANYSGLAGIVVAAPADKVLAYQAQFGEMIQGVAVRWVAGGETRRASVDAGLRALPMDCDSVIIHDAARPLLTGDLLDAVLAPIHEGAAAGAIVGIPCTDTLKQVGAQASAPASADYHLARVAAPVMATVPRNTVWHVQTPQAFKRDMLEQAHATVALEIPVTDDAQLLELLASQHQVPADSCQVVVVPGHERNLKITTPNDMALAEWWLTQG